MPLLLPALAVASLIGGVVPSPPAQITNAQRESLRGLTSVRIAIENPNEHAVACGLTRGALDLAATSPLADADLTIDQSAPAELYVNVYVLPTCVAYILVSAQTTAPAFLPHSRADTAVFVSVDLWRAGYLMDGQGEDFGRQAAATVRDLVAEFVALVTLANR